MLVILGLYLVFTIAAGLFAARKVKSAGDFLLAGRSLGLSLSTATLFATWFGAETVLGASSRMSKDGLLGIIEDPFGATLCLLLVSLLLARPIYKLNLTTIGDYYRIRFGKVAELLASGCLVVSYLGWIAAQFIALGLIAEVVGGVDRQTGMTVGALVVLLYTFFGVMWSVAILDLIQNSLIIIGLLVSVWSVQAALGGVGELPDKLPDNYFRFIPEGDGTDWLNYIAAWLTIGIGSLPQQDIFQRVTAAKSAKVAVWAGYIGSACTFSSAPYRCYWPLM